MVLVDQGLDGLYQRRGFPGAGRAMHDGQFIGGPNLFNGPVLTGIQPGNRLLRNVGMKSRRCLAGQDFYAVFESPVPLGRGW